MRFRRFHFVRLAAKWAWCRRLFYRHFQDIDELGTAINEALGHTLQSLRDHLQLGRTRTHEGQIASSVGFFWKVWSTRHCTGTLLSLSAMGNQAVQHALDEQIGLFAQIMTDDLAMQPAFGHLNQKKCAY
ncbi:MAG: hypothetical protein U1E91_05260 [Moraxella sp.]